MTRELAEKIDALLVKMALMTSVSSDKLARKIAVEVSDEAKMLIGEAEYQSWYIQTTMLE